jgi:hypothetical protein
LYHAAFVLDFEHLNFGFVSDFVLRASNLNLFLAGKTLLAARKNLFRTLFSEINFCSLLTGWRKRNIMPQAPIRPHKKATAFTKKYTANAREHTPFTH